MYHKDCTENEKSYPPAHITIIKEAFIALEKAQEQWNLAKQQIHLNFKSATLNFLFIIVFVNLFQQVFGMENSIVGVVFAILMSASMARDLTAAPIKHLFVQTVVLLLMASAACFVSNAPALLAFPVNLAMICLILYAYTYEYANHLYLPYILSYLFLVFISPVSPGQLPKRLLGMLVGAVCIILYQLVNGRNRIAETARDVLLAMIDEADQYISDSCVGTEGSLNPQKLRADLCKLSKIVYDRRKKALCISDASFAMIDCGRGLENLIHLLHETGGPVTPERAELLKQISKQLAYFRSFMRGESEDIQLRDRSEFGAADNLEAQQFFKSLVYIREHMLKMTLPERRNHYHKTLLSTSLRLKAALHVSTVRVVYALRVSFLLALCTLLVQALQLPHGKWLLFTVASVSLPYADDISGKVKKRLLATAIGGLSSFVIFSLVQSAAGRTAAMMLSGYLSYYFTDYSATFACSTVGALGGAVLTSAFGWGPVGQILAIRVGYIVAGVLLAMLANCLICPFKKEKATHLLFDKYVHTTGMLTKICQEGVKDPQLYYSLVIQAHLQEDKLSQNAKALNWSGAMEALETCRNEVRMAHRAKLDSASLIPSEA